MAVTFENTYSFPITEETLPELEEEQYSPYTLLAISVITTAAIAAVVISSISVAIVIPLALTLDVCVLLIDSLYCENISSQYPAYDQEESWADPVTYSIPFRNPNIHESNIDEAALSSDHRVDPAHFRATVAFENNIPEPPAHISVEKLRSFFEIPAGTRNNANFINCDEPLRPDYFNLNTISDLYGQRITRQRALQDVNAWIQHIQRRDGANNAIDVSGVPHGSNGELYYQKLEKLLKYMVFKFEEMETDLIFRDPAELNEEEGRKRLNQIKVIDNRNRILFDIALSMGTCGGHVLGEALKGCQYAMGLEVEGFEETVKSKLHDARRAIIDEISREYHPFERNRQVHIPFEYLKHLCTDRGIMGGDAVDSFHDPLPSGVNITKRTALERFDAKYTSERIVDIIHGLVNGIARTVDDPLMPGSERIVRDREVEMDDVVDWFKNPENIPQQWLDRPLEDGYQNVEEQFWSEWVIEWQNEEMTDYIVSQKAIIHFLKQINVIAE